MSKVSWSARLARASHEAKRARRLLLLLLVTHVHLREHIHVVGGLLAHHSRLRHARLRHAWLLLAAHASTHVHSHHVRLLRLTEHTSSIVHRLLHVWLELIHLRLKASSHGAASGPASHRTEAARCALALALHHAAWSAHAHARGQVHLWPVLARVRADPHRVQRLAFSRVEQVPLRVDWLLHDRLLLVEFRLLLLQRIEVEEAASEGITGLGPG